MLSSPPMGVTSEMTLGVQIEIDAPFDQISRNPPRSTINEDLPEEGGGVGYKQRRRHGF